MNLLYSTVNTLRDRYTPASHTSTFRKTGKITPEEFVAAGDYLVYKFPTWSWADAEPSSRRSPNLPPGKQFLVTRNVPCRHRLDDSFADQGTGVGGEEVVERGVDEGGGVGADDEDGWLRTGGAHIAAGSVSATVETRRQERGGDKAGSAFGNKSALDGGDDDDDDDDIPDMEEEVDEEAIIPDTGRDDNSGYRSYTMYIMYSPYYSTPRLYLSGYLPNRQPLPPHLMMDDIVGDYKDKTVTLEDFPFFAHSTKMASVHPCKHAAVMKVLLDRADGALKRRREKMIKAARASSSSAAGAAVTTSGMEGLVEDTERLSLKEPITASGPGGPALSSDDWEDVQADLDDSEVAIRVDQYLVVFLKFIASVTPGIEHDFTMSV